MAALDYRKIGEIDKAIRGILLGGRIYLKDDMVVGETTVPVGQTVDDWGSELDGWRFFNEYTTAATLVQPGASDEPDDIEHSEDVTIDDGTFVAGAGKDIELESAVSKAYTVARSAYIRPTTVPTICQGLQVIQSDFIPAMSLEPQVDVVLPGIIVNFKGARLGSFTNEEIGFTYSFRIYYCDIIRDDRDNTMYLCESMEELAALLLEDNELGGTVLDSDVLDIVPWHESLLAQRGMKFWRSVEEEIGWAQCDLTAMIPQQWCKRPSLS